MAQARIRTAISNGPGGAIDTSSTASGSPKARQTAARMSLPGSFPRELTSARPPRKGRDAGRSLRYMIARTKEVPP